jgi:excisionase family DNA binding protein
MDTHRYPTGYRPGPAAGSDAEIGRVLAHLEQRLVELDRLHHEIAEDAQVLAHAAAATPEGRDGAGARSVYSVRAAATELGVSVSMLHKLLKQRRLGHLKVGARALITAEHLEQFREASEVPAPETAAETSPERALTVTGQGSSVHQGRPTRTEANAWWLRREPG